MTPAPNEYIPPHHGGGYRPHDPSLYQENYDKGYREGMNARPNGVINRTTQGERYAAMAAHLIGPVAIVLSLGWAGFVGPLLLWLAYRRKSEFVRTAAARSFNFNLVLWIGIVIGRIFRWLWITTPLAWLIWGLVGVTGLLLHGWAAKRASQGRLFRYPFGIPVLT